MIVGSVFPGFRSLLTNAEFYYGWHYMGSVRLNAGIKFYRHDSVRNPLPIAFQQEMDDV